MFRLCGEYSVWTMPKLWWGNFESEGMPIVIRVNDVSKIVSLWFASDEPGAEYLPEDVKRMCAEYRAQKYMFATFRSGNEDVFENTLAMLKHNRRLTAENEVKQAKLAGE